MPNDFYTNQDPPENATKANANNEAADRAAIAAAFDKLPTLAAFKRGITHYATDTGAANAYVVAMPYLSALVGGEVITFIPSADNTGASVINVSTTGNKAILTLTGAALVAGDILASSPTMLQYDGVNWRLLTAARIAALVAQAAASASAAAASAAAAGTSETNAGQSATDAAASAGAAATSETNVTAMETSVTNTVNTGLLNLSLTRLSAVPTWTMFGANAPTATADGLTFEEASGADSARTVESIAVGTDGFLQFTKDTLTSLTCQITVDRGALGHSVKFKITFEAGTGTYTVTSYGDGGIVIDTASGRTYALGDSFKISFVDNYLVFTTDTGTDADLIFSDIDFSAGPRYGNFFGGGGSVSNVQFTGA